MKYETKIKLVSLVGTIFLGLALFSRNLEDFICSDSHYCSTLFVDDFYLFLTGFAIFLSFTILLFLREQALGAWFKFAVVFIPISLVTLIFSSPTDGGFIGSSREYTFFGLAIIYCAVTIIIIFYHIIQYIKKYK